MTDIKPISRIPVYLFSLIFGLVLPGLATAKTSPDPAAFESVKLMEKVKNLRPVANWIGTKDRFWLRYETATGTRFIVVDAATGEQTDAFDHSAMAQALTVAGLEDSKADNLPLTSLTWQNDGLIVTTTGGSFRCTLDATRCASYSITPPSTTAMPSPDGQHEAFIRDHNIWLRTVATGAEQMLSSDGAEGFAYGTLLLFDTKRVQRRRSNTPKPVIAIHWSPDSRYLIALREDVRSVIKRPYVTEHLPPDNSFTVEHMDYVITVADNFKPPNELAVFDISPGTGKGKKIVADVDSGWFRDTAPFRFAEGFIWWNLSDNEVFFITADYGGQTYRITAMDLHSGSTRTVAEGTEEYYYAYSATDYVPPSFFVSSDGKEAIFYSQASGAGQLYLHDARTGALKNPITDGRGVVFEIMRIDAANRQVYFTAGGRVAGQNPYHTQLYRVSFDGGDITLLTPEDAVHDFAGPWGGVGGGLSQFSPSGKYFVDVYSTLTQAPKMIIRSKDGKKIADVLGADTSQLMAFGWTPPEQFVVKAADGTTDLWGVMFKPRDFDPTMKYAVVDQTYPGPQIDSAPHTFMDSFASSTARDAQATAEAGLIVVAVDGRGTTRRDRAFRYAFAGTEDIFGSADHRAAIENLAQKYPWVDDERVGITGGSFGGYGSLRAALLHPGFFDVVVSHVGPHEYKHSMISGDFTNERFFGAPGSARDSYDKISNIAIIDRLQADLMLVYGEIDENVPFRAAMTIFDALMKADKDFTAYVVPNASHAGTRSSPYIVKRQRLFFIEHLGGPVRP